MDFFVRFSTFIYSTYSQASPKPKLSLLFQREMRRGREEKEARLNDFCLLCSGTQVLHLCHKCVLCLAGIVESTIQPSPFLLFLTSQRLFSQLFPTDTNLKSNGSTILSSYYFVANRDGLLRPNFEGI